MRREYLVGKGGVTDISDFISKDAKARRLASGGDVHRRAAFRNALYARQQQHLQKPESPDSNIIPLNKGRESK